MKSKYIVFALTLFMSMTLLTACTHKDEEKEDKKDSKTSEVKVIDDVDEDDEVDEDEPVVDDGIESTADFSKFSQNQQELGEGSTVDATITSVTDSAEQGFHRITFNIKAAASGEAISPRLVARYRSDIGAIRVTLQNIVSDKSSISYQSSKTIDKDGIVKLYHNITAEEDTEIYDIGVIKATEFYLHEQASTSPDAKTFYLDVKYPGASDVAVNPTNNTFSMGSQTAGSATSAEGATVVGYSYSVVDGALKFVWDVRGSADKPIPTASAAYDASGSIIVTFSSLKSDFIAGGPGSAGGSGTLVGNVQRVDWKRNADGSSTYTFKVANKKDFKLSSATNPNQMILEVKL